MTADACTSFETDALAGLRRHMLNDLQKIEVPPRPWVPEATGPDGQPAADVVIVGAGLSGLTIAFGLKRKGMERLEVIDAAPRGEEGPWLTTARMHTLRSPKWLSGPDLGVPSLTYRAWHEARYGTGTYDALDKIHRKDWMNYLIWYRESLDLPVRNESRLVGIEDAGDGLLALKLDAEGGRSVRYARKLVLGTGIEGGGGPMVPTSVSRALAPDRYTHSAHAFDTAKLDGKRVVVLGAAASAFDWAVTALGAGAAQVDLVARDWAMPQTEILDWSNFAGFLDHFGDLSPEERLAFTRRMVAFRTPPTQEMYDRACGDRRFTMHVGSPIAALEEIDDEVHVTLQNGTHLLCDHMLLGTGYAIDLSMRPELSTIARDVATWGDVAPTLFETADEPFAAHPYLGAGFQLTAKPRSDATHLRNIHLFNNAAVLSLGPICNGVTGLKYGVPRLVSAITGDLFRAHTADFFASLDRFNTQHFDPRRA